MHIVIPLIHLHLGDLLHFGMNMIAFSQASQLIQYVQKPNVCLVSLYLFGGIIGGFFQVEHCLKTQRFYQNSIGASDSVLALFAYTALMTRDYTFISLFTAFTLFSLAFDQFPSLGHASHLGGICSGFLYYYLQKRGFK